MEREQYRNLCVINDCDREKLAELGRPGGIELNTVKTTKFPKLRNTENPS